MATQEEVCKQICGILMEKFGVAEDKLDRAFWKEPLTGFHFELTGANMVYLLFETEKVFDIRIPADYLECYGFSTIEKAARSVAEVVADDRKPGRQEAEP